MNKRILTLVLALVMVFSLAVGAFAAPAEADNAKVQWLVDKGIIEGRLQDDGKTKDLELDKTITREEVAKIVIYYRGSESLARALQGTKGIFTDVNADRWSNGFINAAQVEKLVEGYPDKTFQPAGDITYAEMAAILVRMNKKWTAADEKNAEWPLSYIDAAEKFGILKGLNIKDFNAKAVREKVFEMMYNAFDGKYQAPVANDRLGVVSRIWANEIELNGKDTYTIEKGTVVINGKNYSTFDVAKLYGALVRIVVDGENNVSHIVKLGDAEKYEAIPPVETLWEGIVNKGSLVSDATIAANVMDKDGFEYKGVKYIFDGNTRFFVSDVKADNFFEAKKAADAVDFKNVDHMDHFYFAYDTSKVAGKNYVRAIVFSSGKDNGGDSTNYRVVGQMARDFKLTVEDVFAKEIETSFAKFNKAFPFNYDLDNLDVASFVLDKDNNVKSYDKIIDYSEDEVYAVENREDFRLTRDGKVTFVRSFIELKDEHGDKQTFDLDPKADIFTHTAMVAKNNKGLFNVQVRIKGDTIDVVSIVDKDLEGALPAGKGSEICFNAKDVGLQNADLVIDVDGKVYNLKQTAAGDILLKDGSGVAPGDVQGLCGKVSKNRDGLWLVDIVEDADWNAKKAACEAAVTKATADIATAAGFTTPLSAEDYAKAKDAMTAVEEANKCAVNFGLTPTPAIPVDAASDYDTVKTNVEAYEKQQAVNAKAQKVAAVTEVKLADLNTPDQAGLETYLTATLGITEGVTLDTVTGTFAVDETITADRKSVV